MLTDKNMIFEKDHGLNSCQIGESFKGKSGVQRIYRVGDYGLSAVNHPALHIFDFAWEFAVIKFKHPTRCDMFEIVYDTPLTKDVEVFGNDERASEFVEKFSAWATNPYLAGKQPMYQIDEDDPLGLDS